MTALDSDSGRGFDLGPIDQVGYVVEDLEAALPRYTALYGPFHVVDSPLEDCLYRGRTVACHLRLAVNRSGPIEIELIEVVGGEAPHSEFLRARGEGLHHVRFRSDDLDARLSALSDEGFETIFYKRFAPNLAFAYVEAPREMGGHVIELLEMNPG